MKRIIIICEGQTEAEFCKVILTPYFQSKDIYIQTPLIKKSKGGIVKWEELKKQISKHLQIDKTAFVTTFIDYYGINEKHVFPNWEEANAEPNKNKRMNTLESAMLLEIDDKFRHRYLPYIQLHEFEGLLFNDIAIFYSQIPPQEIIGKQELIESFQNYPNPELINEGKETAPSKRLDRIIAGYDKIVYGSILAEEIGLIKIREKSPRFNDWIENMENM
jgi:hypothetical protein